MCRQSGVQPDGCSNRVLSEGVNELGNGGEIRVLWGEGGGCLGRPWPEEREKSGAGLGSYVRDTLWQPVPAMKPQKITETISKVEAKKIPANGKLIVNIFRNILITYIGVCSKAPASSSMWLFQIKKN